MPKRATVAPKAIGALTTSARFLYVEHLNAVQGSKKITPKRLASLKKKVLDDAQKLCDACDAVPLTIDEISPE